MIFSREMCGVVLMIASGACVTCEMVTSKLIEQSQWPYWYLLAVSVSLGTIPVAMLLYFRPTNWPSLADTKWILARSAFEDLHWYLAVVAVIIGAPPGDVAALTSIDIIAAAFFGLIFLGEQLRKLHLVALVLAIGGAICIARPEFIFGFSQSSCRYCTVGYCLALLSGCFQAASFICARKSAHVSIGVLTLTSLLLAIPMALVPPFLPMGHKDTAKQMLEEPGKAVGLILIITTWALFSIALPAAGATRCPAAVSAIVFTSSAMVSGYIAQIVLFGEMPRILTVVGAGSMLLSVVLMTILVIPSTQSKSNATGMKDEEEASECTESTKTEIHSKSEDADISSVNGSSRDSHVM